MRHQNDFAPIPRTTLPRFHRRDTTEVAQRKADRQRERGQCRQPVPARTCRIGRLPEHVRTALEERAHQLATDEIFTQVERYAFWAWSREWGDRDELLSFAMETAWKALIYAAEQEWRGLRSFGDDGGVRPWVMASVRRRLQWERDRRQERKSNCFDATGETGDAGAWAVSHPDKPAIEDMDRESLWDRVNEALAPHRSEAVRMIYVEGLSVAEVASRRGVRRQAVDGMMTRTAVTLRESLAAYA